MDFQDGINCINIYSKGMTPLGKSLSNWSECNITISLGKFRTLEGLIFYLGSFDEKFRKMSGAEAKAAKEKLTRNIKLPEDIFKRFVIEAMWAKVNGDKDLKQAIKESALPFVHYYNYSGKKQFVPNWDWQIQEWEKIRQQLKDEELY